MKYCKMTECKAAKTRLQAELSFNLNEREMLSVTTPYRQLLGLLFNSSNTLRSDILFAVKYLSCFGHHPDERLWRATKQLISYLKCTTLRDVVSKAEGKCKVCALSEAYWGQGKPTWKYISRVVLMCAGGMIRWISKQKTSVVQSLKVS